MSEEQLNSNLSPPPAQNAQRNHHGKPHRCSQGLCSNENNRHLYSLGATLIFSDQDVSAALPQLGSVQGCFFLEHLVGVSVNCKRFSHFMCTRAWEPAVPVLLLVNDVRSPLNKIYSVLAIKAGLASRRVGHFRDIA